jgi:hypothetical protein
MMAMWQGGGPFTPGEAAADLNRFMVGPYPRLFYVKPKVAKPKAKAKAKVAGK